MEHIEGVLVFHIEIHVEHFVEEAALTDLWLANAEQVAAGNFILELTECLFQVDFAYDTRIRAGQVDEIRCRLVVLDKHQRVHGVARVLFDE